MLKTDDIINELNELSEDIKVDIYVLGMLQELKDKGLMEGGITLTEKGKKFFQVLRDNVFTPTLEQEMESFYSLQAEFQETDEEFCFTADFLSNLSMFKPQ